MRIKKKNKQYNLFKLLIFQILMLNVFGDIRNSSGNQKKNYN